MSLQGTINRPPRDGRHSGVRGLGEVVTRHAGPALIIGGLLWVATYVVEILIGVLLGAATYADPDPSSSWLVWLWPATFMAAIFCLATGLLGVASQVGRRGRVLAVLGGLLAGVALTASSINIVRLTGVLSDSTPSNNWGFLGVIGVLGGSVLLGGATLRARALPRRARLTLLLLPLAFAPAIIATIPLEAVAPDYVVADLPFPVVGLVLAAVGLSIHRDGRSHATVNTASRQHPQGPR